MGVATGSRRCEQVVHAAGVVLVLTVVSITAGGRAEPDWRSKVDAAVLAEAAHGANARFLVVMREQADVARAVDGAGDRATQGRRAVGALRRAAASQSGVLAALDSWHVPARALWVVDAVAVEAGLPVVQALASRPDVLALEYDGATLRATAEAGAASPSAPRGVEWNIARIGAPAVWAAGVTGQGIVYANADSGVSWQAPTLKRSYRGWDGSVAAHDYNWWDAIRTDLSGNGGNPCGFGLRAPCDDHSHGSHVMGIAVGDDGQGNQIGVAPGARWIACRNMDEGTGSPSTYIECLQFFLAPTDLNGQNPDPSKRPNVIGNSYGCVPEEGCTSDSLRAAVDNVRAAGIFFAAAAGNEGRGGCSTVSFPPAQYDSATSVGATDQNDGIAVFSSRGPVTADGSLRPKPDLVAPGVGVRSASRSGYVVFSGTSMAAPHVGGSVALLWSAFPELVGQVDATEKLLEDTASHLTSIEGCGGDAPTTTPNNTFGHGRIDVAAAVQAQETAVAATLSIASAAFTEGNAGTKPATLTVSLSRASTRAITVSWATRDGTASAAKDYRSGSGKLTFAPRERTKQITVALRGDREVEPDEIFEITLDTPDGATVQTGSALVTIRNDDIDRSRPALTGFRVVPAVAPARARIAVSLTSSEPARLACSIERRAATGWKIASRFTRKVRAGTQRLQLPGRRGPGAYRIGCSATDAAGNTGRTVQAPFRLT